MWIRRFVLNPMEFWQDNYFKGINPSQSLCSDLCRCRFPLMSRLTLSILIKLRFYLISRLYPKSVDFCLIA